MIRASWTRLGSFARNRAGVGAVEFALILPVALLLMLMGFDTARFVLSTQRIEEIANTAAEMLAQTPVNSSAILANDGTVSDGDLHFYWDSALFLYPDAAAAAQAQGVAWSTQLVVNMTSITFVASPSGCTTGCTYKAKVVWTTNNYRPCGSTISAVPDTTAPTPSTLPTDVFGPGSIIVVDVRYTWQPTFGAAYLPSFDIARSAYMSPRNVNIVEAASGDTLASNCPGIL
jgi:Flp pilus assembly protein TadG